MSSKSEIITDVMQTYNKYEHIFQLIKVDEDRFLKWFDGFKTYEGLRKANTYIHGGSQTKKFTKGCLLRNLMICQEAYKHFTPEQWERLLFMAGQTHRQVAILRQTVRELAENWKQRPKPPRRRGE